LKPLLSVWNRYGSSDCEAVLENPTDRIFTGSSVEEDR
jgi:hypothetical protein